LTVLGKVEYDSHGRTMFNPSYHTNHRKPFTLDDLIYISKFIDYDGLKSLSLALGKTEKTIASKLSTMRKTGEYYRYKAMTLEDWEKIAGEGSE
jgi:hypothetical protein